MILENNLNITNQVDLAKAEERLSKQRAKQLFDTGDIEKVDVGTFAGLAFYTATCSRMSMRSLAISAMSTLPRGIFALRR